MKRGMIVALACVLLIPAVLASADTKVVTLYAGQTIDVGTLTVSNDGTNLTVTYAVTGDWLLFETHLAVAKSLSAIPQKNGNPPPGQFPYKHEGLGGVTSDSYTIALADLSAAAGDVLYIAAHAVVVRPLDELEAAYETVWQIGDVEVVNATTGWLENYADEFNWGPPAGPITAGPTLAQNRPAYTDPFIVGTTPTNEFPYNSNKNANYATDFQVQWSGALPFGGELIISWSPGQSAAERKVVGDGITSTTLNATGSPRPGEGWFLDTYPLVQQTVTINPVPTADHTIRFQHTLGDGTFWDWIRLEKPQQMDETAWADGPDFSGKNWATYLTYTVQAE